MKYCMPIHCMAPTFERCKMNHATAGEYVKYGWSRLTVAEGIQV